MTYMSFVRDIAIKNQPIMDQHEKMEKEGIFDSEQSLLDFEEGIDMEMPEMS